MFGKGSSAPEVTSSPNTARIHPKDPFWNGKKKGFAVAVTSVLVMLQLLFLGNLSYLYGSIYRSGTRVHNFKVLAVDYDGGIIGQSLQAAYGLLESDSFPGLEIRSVADYPTQDSIRNAVCKGDYWAGVYTFSGASDRLSAALAGGAAAVSYNASTAIQYVWNEARYPTIAEGTIEAKMETLLGASRLAYNQINGTRALQSLNPSDTAAASVLLNPIQSSNINIQPFSQSGRVLYGTVTIVMAIVMQFFFLMAVNGVASKYELYSKLPLLNNYLLRMGTSTAYTFFGSLCMTGYIYAFREDHYFSGGQFMLIWMVTWLYMFDNFLVIDILTTFIPMSFVPFFFLTWAIINVTSTIEPFPGNPGFYHWGYALPAHEVYQVYVQIFSGCDNQLRIALPVLFGWVILCLPLAVFALWWRCRKAAEADRAANRIERVMSTMTMEVRGSNYEGSESAQGYTTSQNLEAELEEDRVKLNDMEERAYGPRNLPGFS